MGKKIKLYKCTGMFMPEELTWHTVANVVTEYIFANTWLNARNIFIDRHKTEHEVHVTVSKVNITPGLVIYKNKYNNTIEDNELRLSMDSGDKDEKNK